MGGWILEGWVGEWVSVGWWVDLAGGWKKE